jgi:hypothetical protein
MVAASVAVIAGMLVDLADGDGAGDGKRGADPARVSVARAVQGARGRFMVVVLETVAAVGGGRFE